MDSSGTVTEADILVRATQSRLLCVVVTAITKLATCHRELRPRAHVCLTKVSVLSDGAAFMTISVTL